MFIGTKHAVGACPRHAPSPFVCCRPPRGDDGLLAENLMARRSAASSAAANTPSPRYAGAARPSRLRRRYGSAPSADRCSRREGFRSEHAEPRVLMRSFLFSCLRLSAWRVAA